MNAEDEEQMDGQSEAESHQATPIETPPKQNTEHEEPQNQLNGQNEQIINMSEPQKHQDEPITDQNQQTNPTGTTPENEANAQQKDENGTITSPNEPEKPCEAPIDQQEPNPSKSTKKGRSVRFDSVDVYYFKRQQGFICIPYSGSHTLGMSYSHCDTERFTLDEYLSMRRQEHLSMLGENELMQKALADSIGKKDKNLDIESEKELLGDIHVDIPISSEFFCPMLSPEQVDALIASNGVVMEPSEAQEIAQVRKSREKCGCSCKDSCETDACSCKANGIQCQLDRGRYPCSCAIRRCKNPFGLKRFDWKAVRQRYESVLAIGGEVPVLNENENVNPTTGGKKAPAKKGRKRKAKKKAKVTVRSKKAKLSEVEVVDEAKEEIGEDVADVGGDEDEEDGEGDGDGDEVEAKSEPLSSADTNKCVMVDDGKFFESVKIDVAKLGVVDEIKS